MTDARLKNALEVSRDFEVTDEKLGPEYTPAKGRHSKMEMAAVVLADN